MPALLEASGCCQPPCRWSHTGWSSLPGWAEYRTMSFASSLLVGYQGGFLWQRGPWKILSVGSVLGGGQVGPVMPLSPISQTLTARSARSWPPSSLPPACPPLLPGSPVPVTKHKGLFSVLSETYGHKKAAAWRQGGGSWRPWDYQSQGVPEGACSLPQLLKGQGLSKAMEWRMCLASLPCYSLGRQISFCKWILGHQHIPLGQAGPT